VKEFLSRAGQTYVAKNVEEDDAAYRELMELGIWTVPVTVIGDRIVKGFDRVQLQRALADAGGGSSPDR
jgi:hypothetical protein